MMMPRTHPHSLQALVGQQPQAAKWQHVCIVLRMVQPQIAVYLRFVLNCVSFVSAYMCSVPSPACNSLTCWKH